MSKTKAGGSTRNGRDSRSKRLGVKLFGGQLVRSGDIIVRQRGTKIGAGPGTKLGHDHTVFAVASGQLSFRQVQKKLFTGSTRKQTVAQVSSK